MQFQTNKLFIKISCRVITADVRKRVREIQPKCSCPRNSSCSSMGMEMIRQRFAGKWTALCYILPFLNPLALCSNLCLTFCCPQNLKKAPKMFYLWRRVPAGGDCVIFLALGVLPNQGAKRSHNKVVFLIAHTFPKLCAEHSRPFSSPVQHIHKQHKSGSRAVQEVTSTAQLGSASLETKLCKGDLSRQSEELHRNSDMIGLSQYGRQQGMPQLAL